MTSSSAPRIIALCILAAAAAGCSQSDQRPVPRREAYPRIADYGTDYAVPPGLPLQFKANAKAVASVESRADGSVWLSIAYPAYGAKAYCTFTPVDDTSIAQVMANRADRMKQNFGSARPDIEEIDGAAGAISTLATSLAVPTTPVQFVGAAPGWVLSGAVFFEGAGPATSADSIAPMVQAIRADLAKALSDI